MRGELSKRTLRKLHRLPVGVRADLVRLLTSSSDVRADVIRQLHGRGKDGMVEVLADLEADDLIRLAVIEELGRADESSFRGP